MLKAVIYTRVSTDKQAEEGTSLDVQESTCLRKAAEVGAEVVEILTDEGVSGAFYLSRPGIQKALASIEAGAANVLITMKLDRSGRDTDVLRLIRKRILMAGGQLLFADGMNFDNSAVGDLMFTQMSAFAEFERKLIRERTRSGKKRRAEQGQQPMRSRSPYGLHIVLHADVIAGRWAPETIGTYQLGAPETVSIVQEIFRRYDAQESLTKICRALQSAGVPTPRGAAMWRPPTLLAILRNPAYKGAPRAFALEAVTDESRLARGMKQATYSRKATRGQPITLQAPKLVSVEVWERVQERLDEAQSMQGGPPKCRFLLSTFLRCPECGRGMYGHRQRSQRFHGRDHYACGRRRPQNTATRTTCHRGTYPIETTDTGILLGLLNFSRTPALLDDAQRAYQMETEQPNSGEARRKQIDAELAALDARERAAVEAQIAGIQAGASPGVYTAVFKELRSDRERLERERAFLPTAQAAVIPFPRGATERAAAAIALLEDALTSPHITILWTLAFSGGIGQHLLNLPPQLHRN